ncbi:hypothetical protein SERLADRAFT_473629 [Serpula lacrymans var. lacrymans S7.9]|uniref:Uncharacterized protein n=1 Tax=Serpula lacrymans var. lacrymans (strain S7.9) TaxID=578457 RepID=F8P364_SERL9|nr:uncharacterized protein SERLADRAFT_473629 [Serpula lacrymans var. lacrymans S7.9]EGO22595.1 hypothetical protein SERLADRAFT_473629 [Serpula lacrymans var. lacrymans S7.9]
MDKHIPSGYILNPCFLRLLTLRSKESYSSRVVTKAPLDDSGCTGADRRVTSECVVTLGGASAK